MLFRSIQSGIKELVYQENKYEDTPSHLAAMRMLNAAGVTIRQFHLGQLVIKK